MKFRAFDTSSTTKLQVMIWSTCVPFASLVSKLSSGDYNAPMHSSPDTFMASCTCET